MFPDCTQHFLMPSSAYIERKGVFIYKDVETHRFPEMATEGQDVDVFFSGTSRVQQLKLHVQVISCFWEQTVKAKIFWDVTSSLIVPISKLKALQTKAMNASFGSWSERWFWLHQVSRFQTQGTRGWGPTETCCYPQDPLWCSWPAFCSWWESKACW